LVRPRRSKLVPRAQSTFEVPANPKTPIGAPPPATKQPSKHRHCEAKPTRNKIEAQVWSGSAEAILCLYPNPSLNLPPLPQSFLAQFPSYNGLLRCNTPVQLNNLQAPRNDGAHHGRIAMTVLTMAALLASCFEGSTRQQQNFLRRVTPLK
jgi:hypothetical protein